MRPAQRKTSDQGEEECAFDPTFLFSPSFWWQLCYSPAVWGNQRQPIPTQISDLEYTQAAETIVAELTQKAPQASPSPAVIAALPSATETLPPTSTSAPTETLPPTSTPRPTNTPEPTETHDLCSYRNTHLYSRTEIQPGFPGRSEIGFLGHRQDRYFPAAVFYGWL